MIDRGAVLEADIQYRLGALLRKLATWEHADEARPLQQRTARGEGIGEVRSRFPIERSRVAAGNLGSQAQPQAGDPLDRAEDPSLDKAAVGRNHDQTIDRQVERKSKFSGRDRQPTQAGFQGPVKGVHPATRGPARTDRVQMLKELAAEKKTQRVVPLDMQASLDAKDQQELRRRRSRPPL